MSKAPADPDRPQRLGRGLAALLGSGKSVEAQTLDGVQRIPIEFLRPSPRNPRREFREDDLNDLASSIKLRGVLQPIIVRAPTQEPNVYEIVAGERRWRAAQRAGLHSVPIIPVEITDRDALEMSIIENVQRTDLNALEEAQAYARLSAEYGYNQTDIGRVVGKSRSHVANTLRLLALPPQTRKLLATGALSAGHARALLPLDDPDAAAERIVAEGMTVREVEELSKLPRAAPVTREKSKAPDLVDLERRLSALLGAAITLRASKKSAEIRIRAAGVEQLTDICDKLVRGYE